ncbi:TMC domain protein [Dictyocaulus viviparus]|uniref:TMC domain protein n=1 Tax=Dictyocaulus viviparus TaxID=29172 RepID=A0A0D8XFX7_DICVI|nr:TMC domain protein [Dictyocaulus viviparus]
MDAIRRKEPVNGVTSIKKRQLGGRNPNLPRPPPYASRTFENRADLLRFIDNSTKRFDQNSMMNSASTTPFTILPQFGPVSVNNPNVILRNGTLKKAFEAKKIGPHPLPIYTPPPRTFPPYDPGKVVERFGGPDLYPIRVYPKPITPTPRFRVTRPSLTRKTTTENVVNRNHDTTSDVVKINVTSIGENTDYPQYNETLRIPPAAERKSFVDEVYNADICWETIIGQEIVKLVTMDLIVTIVSILVIDFIRGLWIKYCSSWWCWDIETTFPEYGEFKVAENVLHIINNQGMIWLVILLLWLLLCTLPVGFVIASTRPSHRCGPFSQYDHFYTVITKEIEKRVDPFLLGYIRHVASPGVVIPIILFLMLIIYFLVSLVRGLREANTDLQQQLIHERTEEKKKIFELAGGKKKVDQDRERNYKKTVPYLPLVEQLWREPWRPYTETKNATLKAEDSSESENEDMDESQSPSIVHRLAPIPSSTSETVAAMHFHPSLGSLDEKEEEEDEQSGTMKGISKRICYSVSQQLPNNNYQTTSSPEHCEMSSNIVDVPTPEEVRSLLRPFLEMKAYCRGVHGFPREFTPPNSLSGHEHALARSQEDTLSNVPASSSIILSSHRPSNRHSYLSLYEYGGSGISARDDIDGIPTTILSNRPRNSQEMRADVHRLPTTEEFEEEDIRRKKAIVLPGSSTGTTTSKKNGNGNSFDVKDCYTEFQAWPSIDEVQNRREQLLKSTPLPFYQTHLPSESTVPRQSQAGPDTKYSNRRQHVQDASPGVSSTDDERRSASPSRRFRISVSPARKSGTDSTITGNKRRYMIKQESLLDQPTSLTQQTAKSGTSKHTSLTRAPQAAFDEDDNARDPNDYYKRSIS